MFTGIITDIGTVRTVEQKGDLKLTIGCGYDMAGVDLGASISCSGACLTVVDKGEDWFAVDVSQETVSKTAPGLWATSARLNLERALRVGDEIGGHIVTGHVDVVATVTRADEVGGSLDVSIEAPRSLGSGIAPKVQSVSMAPLTVNEVEDVDRRFTINLIPTAEQTTLGGIAEGRKLNVEVTCWRRPQADGRGAGLEASRPLSTHRG
jgi:riboflavin synthase